MSPLAFGRDGQRFDHTHLGDVYRDSVDLAGQQVVFAQMVAGHLALDLDGQG